MKLDFKKNYECMAMKNIIVQFCAITWIYAKALAVSLTITFVASLQSQHSEKDKKNLSYENSFDLPAHLVAGTRTDPQNILWKLLKIRYFKDKIMLQIISYQKIRDFRWNR